jgi:hypothetical protein
VWRVIVSTGAEGDVKGEVLARGGDGEAGLGGDGQEGRDLLHRAHVLDQQHALPPLEARLVDPYYYDHHHHHYYLDNKQTPHACMYIVSYI